MSRTDIRSNRKRSHLPVRAEINVTSLVDVAFTLLVIFIITAPALQGGMEVELPKGHVGVLRASDAPIIVSIQRDGTVFLGETPVPQEEIEITLGQLIRATGTDVVYFKADAAARWEWVYRAISIVAEEGVTASMIAEEDLP